MYQRRADRYYDAAQGHLGLLSAGVHESFDGVQLVKAFGFQAATIRTLDDLKAVAPMLAQPEGPIFLDCKLNAAIAAPFMSEIHEHETRRH